MQQNFYVPYNQVKFFTLKEGGTYRHGLAFRLYLYLCHYNSGRIKWESRKELVHKFNSSHTAIHKALAYLEEIGFIKTSKGWVSAKGHDTVKKLTKDKIGRDFNIEFSFNLDILLDRKKFTNHLFLTLFQSSAMIRGKERNVLIPQENTNSDSVMLKGGLDLNCTDLESSVIQTGFIQKQSSTYLAKMAERNPITIFNRNKKITKEELLSGQMPKRTRLFQNKYRQALTEDGFYPKIKSPLIVSKDKSVVAEILVSLKETDEKYKSCFVIRGKHGGYLITKQPPVEYYYSVDAKESSKKFDFTYKKIDIASKKQPSFTINNVNKEKKYCFSDKIPELIIDESIPLPF